MTLTVYTYVYILGTLRQYMLGQSEPGRELLENVLEIIGGWAYDLVVRLVEDGYLGR